jgi:uncharacterized coiled-coil protein SlyX
MANRIIKGFALAAGAGALLGFSASLGRQRNHVESVDAPPEPRSDTELRMEGQSEAIAALRAEVDANSRRASAAFAGFEQRLAAARDELPATIDAVVARHVNELRARLHSEVSEATSASLARIDQARIDQAIDEKLANRVTALETSLADQSAAIGSLNRRALETDANLQRLISSVERLCDRAGANLAPPEPLANPSFLDLPFQTEYDAALKREPDPTLRMFTAIK